MKALIVTPQPFFTPRGTPLSVYHRTLVMAELGVEADLLTYGEGEDVDIAGVRTIRIPRAPVLEPVKVGPSATKVFLGALLALWAVALFVRNRYDFVDAHEEGVFICRFLKRVFRFKLVYAMHSSLPRQLTSFRFTSPRLWIRLFEWLERSRAPHPISGPADSRVSGSFTPSLVQLIREFRARSGQGLG